VTSKGKTIMEWGVLRRIDMYELIVESINLPLLKKLTTVSIDLGSSREEAAAAFKGGEEQLAGLKRQVVLGKMYPSARSVMDSA
jgi:hypothetical protein